MTLRGWDPFRELLELQERMNRLLETTMLGGPGTSLAPPSWTPLADGYETPEAFILQLELPGVDQEDVEIHVDGDILAVRGQRRMQGQVDSFHRMERSYGPFARTFKLNQEVDPDGVSAQFKDGLLRLEVPKLHRRGSWRSRPEKRE
jgi:HSP20 family protein